MDFLLDPITHDYVADENGFQLSVEDAPFVAQKLKIRLLTRLTEWAFDLTMGIDFDLVIKKDPDERLITGLYVVEILRVPEVVALLTLDLQVDKATRVAQLDFEASTIFSQGVTVSLP